MVPPDDFAHVRDAVGGGIDPPHRAMAECCSVSSQCDQRAEVVQEPPVAVGVHLVEIGEPLPRERYAGGVDRVAFAAHLDAGEQRRHTRHCQQRGQSDHVANEVPADDGAEPGGVVRVEHRHRRLLGLPRHVRGQFAHRLDEAVSVEIDQLDRRHQRHGSRVLQPRPQRTCEPLVGHHAVPARAVEVVAGVVAVLGDEPPPVVGVRVHGRSCGACDHVVVVDRTEPCGGVRTIDAPAVELERRVQILRDHRSSAVVEAFAQGRTMVVEFRQRSALRATPRSRTARRRRRSRTHARPRRDRPMPCSNQSWCTPVWLSVMSPITRIPRPCAADTSDASASSPPSAGSTWSNVDAS